MEKREEILRNFYTQDCKEDERLESKHGSVEFLTTTKYIDSYLNPGDRILEVGCATGKYSLYYANKGYKVNGIDFVKENIDILKSKIKPEMDIKAEQGDALDLSRFNDNTFDKTLVLGPLYHLYTDADVDKAIKEAIRVTKKDGIVAFAYLTHDSIMIDWALKKGHLVDGYKNQFTSDFEMTSVPEEVFRAFYIDEFKQLMAKYPLEYLKNVATDGMAHHLKEEIDALSQEEFDIWMKYHLATCERENLQGYSNHMLYIGRKK